jgi:hypothetical protein
LLGKKLTDSFHLFSKLDGLGKETARIVDFLLKWFKNRSYLQRQSKNKFIFTNDLTKGVSSIHALKTLFSLPARCPNKKESKMTQMT